MDQLISINYKCLIRLSNQSNICTSKCWHSNNCLHFLKNVVRSKSVLFHFHHFCKAGMNIFFCFFHSYIKEFIKSIPTVCTKILAVHFFSHKKTKKNRPVVIKYDCCNLSIWVHRLGGVTGKPFQTRACTIKHYLFENRQFG
jgi:hypothetical protein